MLVLLCKETALDRCRWVAQDPEVGGCSNGYEMWRQFSREFEPQVAGRYQGLLVKVLSTRFEGKNDDE